MGSADSLRYRAKTWMTGGDMDDAKKLWVLWNEREINRLMLQFGRSLDTQDWPRYEACFLSEFDLDFRDLTGAAPTRVLASLWVEFARVVLKPLKAHHQYSNHAITFHGDSEASSVQYHVSHHFKPTARGASTNYQYGWYENEFRRTADGWRISRLCHKFQWVDGNDSLLAITDPEAVAIAARVFGGSDAPKQ